MEYYHKKDTHTCPRVCLSVADTTLHFQDWAPNLVPQNLQAFIAILILTNAEV